ncbi:MAG: exosortase/archaeosortase family protein, partial [Phycisphaerales bacterium]|nr:exosortase/archaeosortase family protein [Phycisphaerales bacterium]
IPFIAGYFVWLCRDRLLQQPFKRSWSGIFVLISGLAWYSLCALGPVVLHHHNLMGFGVGISIVGITLFLFGWRSMKYLWFPLLYLIIFGQTISDRLMEIVTFKLQDIASAGSYIGLSILGLDVTRAGNTIDILYAGEKYPLNIAEACSGMRMLMAFFALGVAMAYTGLRHWWQRTILVLLAVPTAVFVNILRVMTLGLLSIADSGFATGDFHTFIGTLWLVPAFLIYLGIVWILKNIIIEEDEKEQTSLGQNPIRFAKSVTVGFIVVVGILASSAVGLQIGVNALNVYLHKEAVYPRRDLSVIPTLVGNWKSVGDDSRFDKAGVEALGTEIYLSRIYDDANRLSPPVQLHIAYYTGQVDAVPHVPDRCMVAGGFVPLTAEPTNIPLEVGAAHWNSDTEFVLDGEPYPVVTKRNPITGINETIRMPLGDFEIRTTEFSHPQLGDDHVFSGYFFVANGKTTAYPERIRLLAFDPSSKYAYYCKIQFTIRGGRDFNVEEFNDIVSDLATILMPDIMACLPDWEEVTRKDSE